MNVCTWHYRQRYLYVSLTLLFSLGLFIPIRFFKQQLDLYNEDTDQLNHCDQTIIRKHFMRNKRYFIINSNRVL
jgi:hypothetical protein